MPLYTLLLSLAKTFLVPMAILPYRTTPTPASPYPPITMPPRWTHLFTMGGLGLTPDCGIKWTQGLLSTKTASCSLLWGCLCSSSSLLLVPSPGLSLVVLMWYSQKLTT